jgi:hypothetical protein
MLCYWSETDALLFNCQQYQFRKKIAEYNGINYRQKIFIQEKVNRTTYVGLSFPVPEKKPFRAGIFQHKKALEKNIMLVIAKPAYGTS